MLYAVKTPKGVILEWTISDNRNAAVSNLFDACCQTDRNWSVKYWKDWDGSQRAARKLGWRIVKVKVVEVK